MAMENFIKLYPHHLMVAQEEDNFSGSLSFSVEQYGLLVNNFSFSLQLLPPNTHYDHWRFVCEEPSQLNVPKFVLFLKSVEHYVFQTLKFSPIHSLNANETPEKPHLGLLTTPTEPFRLYFKDLFFDTQTACLKNEEA